MNISRLLLITGLVYFAIKQKDVNTKNIILIVTCFIAFNMVIKEGATNSPTPKHKVSCENRTTVNECKQMRTSCSEYRTLDKPCVKGGTKCKEDPNKKCKREPPSPTPTPSPVTVGASMSTSTSPSNPSPPPSNPSPPPSNPSPSPPPSNPSPSPSQDDEDGVTSGSCNNTSGFSIYNTTCQDINTQTACNNWQPQSPGPTLNPCQWVSTGPSPPGPSPPGPSPPSSRSNTCSSCPNGSSGWFMCFFNNCESSKCTTDDTDDEKWCLSDDSINPLGWGLLFGGVLFILIIAALIMNSGGDSGGYIRRGNGRSLRDMVIYNQGELAGLASK